MVYVYLHINELGVFYVGCGNLKRTKDKHHRKLLWKQTASTGYSILIAGEFKDQGHAWEHEKELIAYFKPSCNKAIGGPGSTGFRWPNDKKQSLSQSIKESWISDPGRVKQLSKSVRGLGNPSARLTPEQVIKVREDRRLLREISGEYGVSKGTISLIRNMKTWGHLEES